MATSGAAKRASRIREMWGHLCALLLSCAAACTSIRVVPLHRIPMALSFAAVALVATFFGPRAAVVSILATAAMFNYFMLPPRGAWSLDSTSIVSSTVTVAVGVLIVLLSRRFRGVESRLRTALGSLQERTDALIQAQQGSNSAAWVFDTESRTTSWYEGGAEVFGRSLAEISAMGSPTDLVLEEDRPKIAAAAAHTIQTGENFRVDFRVTWPNGEVHWLEANGAPLANDKRYWLGVTTDISARKFGELALVRSEKLSAAARLASSIAHEINNPLESITNLIYLARQSAGDDETRGYLDAAEREAMRIAHVTSLRLKFYRQQMLATTTDLAELVRDLLKFYEYRLKQVGVAVEYEAEDAPPLVCRAGEIRQALGNLVENAIDAMPQGGCLRIHLRSGTDWRSGSRCVRIAVADNGSGIPAGARRRIFEPFFTTKDDVGTGLGLWVASEIVEKHGGTIRLRSRADAGHKGSVFSIALPYPAANTGPEAQP